MPSTKGGCRSIKSYLAEKICVLVTHQIQFLQDATKIIVLENVSAGRRERERGGRVCDGCGVL